MPISRQDQGQKTSKNGSVHTKLVLTKPSTLKKRKPKNSQPQIAAASLYQRFAQADEEEILGRQELARKRFRLAIRCIRAFVRFQMGLRPKSERKDDSSSYENTYQLEPHARCKFRVCDAEEEVMDVLTKAFEKYTYDSSSAPTMAKILTTSINDRLKMMARKKFPRYKLVSNVMISQNLGQGFGFSSRSLWNDKTDMYACVNHKNATSFVTATVHAVYSE